MRCVFAGTPDVAADRPRRPDRLPPRRGGGHHPPGRPGRPRPARRGLVAGRRARARGGHRGAPAVLAARARRPGPARASSHPTARRSSPTAASSRRRPWASRAHGWVNLHFSLLPAWRGAAPVQHAIWRGDDVTGATHLRPRGGPRHRSRLRDRHRDHPPGRHVRRAPRPPGARRVRACWSPPSTRIESGAAHAGARRPASRRWRRRSPSTTRGSAGTCPAIGIDRQVRACTPAPGPGRPAAASGSVSGPVAVTDEPALRARAHARRQARRARRHGDAVRCGWAWCGRPASARCPRRTGRAAPG